MNLMLVSAPTCAANDVSVLPLLLLPSELPVVEADATLPDAALVPVAEAWHTFKPNVAGVNFSFLADRAASHIWFVFCCAAERVSVLGRNISLAIQPTQQIFRCAVTSAAETRDRVCENFLVAGCALAVSEVRMWSAHGACLEQAIGVRVTQ